MVKAKYTHPEHGYAPIEDLKVNESYDVEWIDMGQSSTYITLVGHSGYYNSVNFDFYEDGKPLDIYRDPRFNHYMYPTDVRKYVEDLNFDRCEV